MLEPPALPASPCLWIPLRRWTKERKAYLRQAFPAGVDVTEIARVLKAMPGLEIGSNGSITSYAGIVLKLHRAPGFVPLSKQVKPKIRTERAPLSREQKAAKEARRRHLRQVSRVTELAKMSENVQRSTPSVPTGRKANLGLTMKQIIIERAQLARKILYVLRLPRGRIPTTEETAAWVTANPDKVTRLPAGWADY